MAQYQSFRAVFLGKTPDGPRQVVEIIEADTLAVFYRLAVYLGAMADAEVVICERLSGYVRSNGIHKITRVELFPEAAERIASRLPLWKAKLVRTRGSIGCSN